MRAHVPRSAFLLIAIALISVGHYTTDLQAQAAHDLYRRLYYLPIIVAAFWYGLRGGLVTAAVVSAAFAPHVVFQWREMPTNRADQYLEMVLYLVVGAVTGALSQRETRHRLALRSATTKIEEAYARLREQSLALFQAEEQLRHADRLACLGELSAGMAHEIRNPLGSIKGTAEIFRDSLGPADRLHEFAQILVTEVDRLNGILTRFLDFARPRDHEGVGAELAPAVRHVVQLTSARARRSGVAVAVEVPDDLPPLAIAPDALRQVLLNLVLNAVQAMSGGGRLTVTARLGEAVRLANTEPAVAQAVHVSVSDDGPGIPVEARHRIFDPFFTTRPGGTGLGLALCQRIVLGHRGAIAFEPLAPTGARFHLEVPPATRAERR
jgi:two-component system, NtrC family, sensor histidine kinase HydH